MSAVRARYDRATSVTSVTRARHECSAHCRRAAGALRARYERTTRALRARYERGMRALRARYERAKSALRACPPAPRYTNLQVLAAALQDCATCPTRPARSRHAPARGKGGHPRARACTRRPRRRCSRPTALGPLFGTTARFHFQGRSAAPEKTPKHRNKQYGFTLFRPVLGPPGGPKTGTT